jgi:glucosamine--fructose-6-phosphate aminotransferase (isomerizing)
LNDLRGAYAIVVVSTMQPDTLYAARLSSPLVIGVGENEYILASDHTALLEHTKKMIYLDDYDVATISAGSCQVHNLKNNQAAEHVAELLDVDAESATLGDYPNFMLKEIFEAPAAIRNATLGRVLADQGIIKLGGLENVAQQLQYIDRFVLVRHTLAC